MQLQRSPAVRFTQVVSDLVPLLDDLVETDGGFDCGQQLTQHELKFTPRAEGGSFPLTSSPRGKLFYRCAPFSE